jgi:hypothetical protein
MQKFKTVFYIIFFLYLVVTFVVIPYDENKAFSFLINHMQTIPYWIGLGLVLYISEWIVENIHIKMLKSKIKSLEKEKDALKVQMFDMESRYQEVDASLNAFGESLPKKDDEI